ncbi:MAG: hypothetical protein ACRDVZ_04030 [Jiangellaceae bacterium]
MSPVASWLFLALGLLLVVMIVFVVLAGLATLRKGKGLARELDGLQSDMGEALGSPDQREPEAIAEPGVRLTRRNPEEEVDHG